MGLDVYLRRDMDRKESRRREASGAHLETDLWSDISKGKSYSDLSNADLETYGAKVTEMRKRLDLDEYGVSNAVERIEFPSKLHPDHLFQVGYFRSSYNSSGFNSVVGDNGLPTLYDIFAVEETDDYERFPDWEKSKEITIAAIESARKIFRNSEPIYKVHPIYDFSNTKVNSPAEALEAFKRVRETFEGLTEVQQDMMCWSSDSNGLFMLRNEPKVVAVILGHDDYRNVAYMIHELSGERKTEYEWYIEAYEIVLETIEYVLSHVLRKSFYLVWSA